MLYVPRRPLSAFTPQQLAAIAWGFVAADMKHPQLFAAIENEARAQPVLDDLLRKAGLLQHLRQRVVQPLAVPNVAYPAMNGGWNTGMGPQSSGQNSFGAIQGNGVGGLSGLGAGSNRALPHAHSSLLANNTPALQLQGNSLSTHPGSQAQYHPQMHAVQGVVSASVNHPPQYSAATISPRVIPSVLAHGVGVLSNQVAGANALAAVPASSSASAQSRYLDVSNRLADCWVELECLMFNV